MYCLGIANYQSQFWWCFGWVDNPAYTIFQDDSSNPVNFCYIWLIAERNYLIYRLIMWVLCKYFFYHSCTVSVNLNSLLLLPTYSTLYDESSNLVNLCYIWLTVYYYYHILKVIIGILSKPSFSLSCTIFVNPNSISYLPAYKHLDILVKIFETSRTTL